jgi:hypothetical protein
MSTSSSSLSIMGSIDCPCIDSTIYASRLENCDFSANETRFWQYPQGMAAGTGAGGATEACYPLSFGSQFCAAHDVAADPLCRMMVSDDDENVLE